MNGQELEFQALLLYLDMVILQILVALILYSLADGVLTQELEGSKILFLQQISITL